MKNATLYFHYPCFDGLVSGVLAWEFLEKHENWQITEFCPANYKLRDRWLKDKLKKPCAIVDFLYHPRADFWADHHQTSILTPQAEADFRKRRGKERLFFDDRAPSCATLLYRYLKRFLTHKPHFREMVYWAEKIDSASYSSVEEAILGDAPALRINRSLLLEEEKNGPGYAYFLLREMRAHDLNYVAGLREVTQREQKARRTLERGLKKAKKAALMKEGEVAVMDIRKNRNQMISRYAPYYAKPHARYSIGIVRSPDGIGITAMRNPWRNFKSVALGRVFEKFGGGGHQRVGAVRLSRNQSKLVKNVVESLLSKMQKPSR
jgi:nanoRNase/pAp phosphatase (c-di-AMP/oligoRNAs hydrolase)